MNSHPILFSGDMVKALLAGRKTQTRRIVKHPDWFGCFTGDCPHETQHECDQAIACWVDKECPYGSVGDQLWVREPFYQCGHWEPVFGVKTKTGKQKWRFVPDSSEIRFVAPPEFRKGRHHKDPGTVAWHKRLARFMPRKASRLSLEITSRRAEILQDISEEDAIAEGINCISHGRNGTFYHPFNTEVSGQDYTFASDAYKSLWQSINGPDSWDKNPWVWVIEFERVKSHGAEVIAA